MFNKFPGILWDEHHNRKLNTYWLVDVSAATEFATRIFGESVGPPAERDSGAGWYTHSASAFLLLHLPQTGCLWSQATFSLRQRSQAYSLPLRRSLGAEDMAIHFDM
jgi:hypothetical protein